MCGIEEERREMRNDGGFSLITISEKPMSVSVCQ